MSQAEVLCTSCGLERCRGNWARVEEERRLCAWVTIVFSKLSAKLLSEMAGEAGGEKERAGVKGREKRRDRDREKVSVLPLRAISGVLTETNSRLKMN